MSKPASLLSALLCTFIWGTTFSAQDTGMDTIGPLTFNAVRFLIGFISIMIRVFNPSYPEGVFLAILLMNVFAPTIDHYVIQSNVKMRLNRLKLKTA